MSDNFKMEEKLFSIDNELDRFDYLTDIALAGEKMNPDDIRDENRLVSCETKTWYTLTIRSDGRIELRAESDSLFVKGLIEIMAEIVRQTSVTELADGRESIGFAQRCYEHDIIDLKRKNGLISLEKEIIKFAKIYHFSGGDHEKSN